MRYAIYFTPPQNDPLTRAAANWLGRDPFGGPVSPPARRGSLTAEENAYHTAAARRYGFHATLKSPFALAEGESEDGLRTALDHFATATAPVILPRVVVSRIDGFFAITPFERSHGLDRLAGDIVTVFDTYRAPMTERDIERRNPDRLRPDELKNLYLWGYPYVFERFRFHMTLTGRVSDVEAPRVEQAILEHFGPLLEEPLEIDTLALFVEPEPGAPFMVRSSHLLGAMAQLEHA
jgi:putative phosphonate metabolism protein